MPLRKFRNKIHDIIKTVKKKQEELGLLEPTEVKPSEETSDQYAAFLKVQRTLIPKVIVVLVYTSLNTSLCVVDPD